jgi:hypothetical protein
MKTPKIYLMQTPVECETAMIATLTQTDYDKVNKLMHRKRWLPDWLENPIYGNPLTVYWVLTKLGFWKDNLFINEFLMGKAVPYKTAMLVKKSLTKQHWVVFCGYDNNEYHFLWGDRFTPIALSRKQVINLFKTDGFVNDCFTVYKCNVFNKLLQRFIVNIKILFYSVWFSVCKKIKSLFK